ncbi:corrinoid adenosyltransferase MMAB-like [Bolinopsis microptera]|uniref:corrinoid adenosyltransferase MMAB-like n=1 Tax=Bolinopsis microptera TaxID=2820187 RepID=UPI00307A0A29
MNPARCFSVVNRCSSYVSSRSMKIYTRTGDKGKTSTYTGKRLPKDDVIFGALGAVDTLSSHIGLSRVHCQQDDILQDLKSIQCNLQDLGSVIATPRASATPQQLENISFSTEHISNLESKIDAYTGHLPPLTNFILPSGSECSAHLHVTRTFARAAERSIVPLLEQHGGDIDAVFKYLNRLSDYLFTAARYCSHHDGIPEEIYTKQTLGDS